MGLSSKLELMANIIRIINQGKNTVNLVTEHLSQQPMVLVTDVIALIPLAKKFGFVDGEEKDLRITKSGLDFMNYIEGVSEEISLFSNPMDEDYSTIDKKIKDIGRKYEKKDSDVFHDIQKIREEVSKAINFAPEISEDDELLLTASIPPNVREKIPPAFSEITIRHDDAVKKVLQNTSKELLIATFSLDVNVFRMLVDRWNTQKITCKLIIADDKFKNKQLDPYHLIPLKKVLNSHFIDSEIRYIRTGDFVSHAKIWLSEKAVHITSANIAINSQTDNFELGIYSTKSYLVESCRTLMEKVWKIGETL